jgi:lipoprotein-releasing system permease protein
MRPTSSPGGLSGAILSAWGSLFLQDQFRIIRLAEADYFLSYAPIHWDITTIILLNIGTLAVTLLFLIIPSFLVSSISPVKAIRFK